MYSSLTLKVHEAVRRGVAAGDTAPKRSSNSADNKGKSSCGRKRGNPQIK